MSNLPPLTYRISKLWGSAQGTVEKISIDEKISYPNEASLDFAGNFVAEVMFIKLKDEISVIISNASIKNHFICQYCLKPFTATIEIPSAEREFLHEPPQKVDDPVDLFLIDLKAMTIDLSEMVRQEIILHFPLIPVCSKSCKGLCPHCGMDRNLKKCQCKEEPADTHKPFQNLKELLSKNVKPQKKVVVAKTTITKKKPLKSVKKSPSKTKK